MQRVGRQVERQHVTDAQVFALGLGLNLGAYRAVRRAVEGGLQFSAVFCASDEMAVGAIGALEDLGLEVPRQVSVVGFDGLPDLPYQLTTVVQNIEQIALEAIQLAEALISGGRPRAIVVPVALRIGATTASRVG